MRLQLSQVLEAVLSQVLLPRVGGGRIAAFEIMIATTVIRRLIREEKIFEIQSNIEMGNREEAQILDQALSELVRSNIVAREEAIMRSSNPVKLNQLLQPRPYDSLPLIDNDKTTYEMGSNEKENTYRR